MKSKYFVLGSTLLLMTQFSCENKTSISEENTARQEILELHHLQKTYHVDKLAKEFAQQLSADHISVNRGKITSSTLEENTARFDTYFNSVEFEKWDDLTPPIIKFSEDLSMAYTIVHKEVIAKYFNEDSTEIKQRTEFSWVAIYKKYPNGYKIDCVASTNLPSQKIK